MVGPMSIWWSVFYFACKFVQNAELQHSLQQPGEAHLNSKPGLSFKRLSEKEQIDLFRAYFQGAQIRD